jgi:hypothetical protein
MRRAYESETAMAMGLILAMQLCGLLVTLNVIHTLA